MSEGLRGHHNRSICWAYGDLSEGDEIKIRVLGPGGFDEPQHVGE
jgi:hypothetical protein